ncbi:NADH dehydrogenase [ubiquinone] 1 beta subcomplex subunit 8, mitochondrial [Neocloeon triangulifer]|uniref:NADH dehydrogenase [ubiquinone] 1 beta subcomplex subunit 8, mitochondrial n=1 Tax=Neocloeon triangulifer TaxID=2078957 RepID=UPI00286F1715|nr:NADH dehydrogenase [ubiquinone] 1 beta subcomplex subunit 8, mitochondrial [Neocloeon triangulifer]
MALLRSLVRKSLSTGKNGAITFQAVRSAGGWNKDFAPGPYPKTEEERRAAAKKYGLHPDEYQPYPDDGFGLGDYPKLPDISGESKDPFYNWDFPEHKRNFGDPIHVHADAYGEDRWNISAKPSVPYSKQILVCIGFIGSLVGIYYLTYDFKLYRPVLPKQLPAQGTHYTFEQAE